MNAGRILDDLFRMQDAQYRDFQIKLIPTVPQESVIGIRTPELRAYASEIVKAGAAPEFIESLPHRYFDENQLHAFILSTIKDFSECIGNVERFLPYVDNWATCDQLSPRVFKKHRPELLPYIERWISSSHAYTVRFGIRMLMDHFLDGDFDVRFLQNVSRIRSEAYYVKMMVTWYFATALAKQYEAAVPFIESRVLEPWTHNKAIQKAVESFRVPEERKAYLKTLRAGKK